MVLIWIRIPKHSEREYAGYFKKDALTKGCGWLSNIIWAKYFEGFGWMIYSKSGYVADDRNTVDYKEDISTEIRNGGYQCPELIRGNHASDIQPFWFDVTSFMDDTGIPYFALPCIFAFQPNFAGVIEGAMHAATACWAKSHADVISIARYGAPGVILGDPRFISWLPPNKIKGKDFKAKDFQWESPHGEMMAFGPIPNFEMTYEFMEELRSTIAETLEATRVNLENTCIAEYPEDSATRQAYIEAMNNREDVEPCGVDIHADEPAAMALPDLLGTIKMESNDAVHNTVQIAESMGLTPANIIESVYMIAKASELLYKGINETTVSNIIRAVRAIQSAIDKGLDPSDLLTALDVGDTDPAANEYIGTAMRLGIDIDEFITATSSIGSLPDVGTFIASVKPCMIFFNELQDLLDDIFSDPLTKTALLTNVGDFRAGCADAIASAFISPFVDLANQEEIDPAPFVTQEDLNEMQKAKQEQLNTVRAFINSVIMTNMESVIQNGAVIVQ